MSLYNVELEHLDKYFQPVIDFALNPLLVSFIENKNFNKVTQLTNNIWFTLIPSKEGYNRIVKEIVASVVTFELSVKTVTKKEEIKENQLKLSYDNFSNLLLDGYDRYYIEETQWKKIDEVEKYLSSISSFKLDNRLFRQLERYSSTYILFGGDKYEALDRMLYAKLLPVIALLELQNNDNIEEKIFELFERLFGLEHLIKSKKIIRDIQENKRKNS